jgi:glycosyltransferase involved in cell wall biosynthesis
MTSVPGVSVLVPTRDRIALLRECLDGILAQDYPGELEILVVYDGTAVDRSLELERPGRRVRVLPNNRRAGLAGVRNTGILAAGHDVVAFCDDDDVWLPQKLRLQMERVLADPTVELCATGILVDFNGRLNPRLAGAAQVQHAQLLRSRMAMLHSSSFVLSRPALLEGLGLLDEDIPGGHNEDWDLLLRASSRGPIAVVDQPLVRVRWGSTSFYARHWDLKIDALKWMLRRHPDIEGDRAGAARVYGQIAFALAATGRRREGARWAIRATRLRKREWRAGAALVVATGLVGGERILDLLHRYGRGV